MPTLGEVLASVLQGVGEGAQHQFATATRGPGYLAKEEELARTGEAAALSQGMTLRDAALKQAAIKAAAAEAARQGVAPEGGTPEEAAAALTTSRESATHESGLAKNEAQSELAAARALAASGQLTPALLAKFASGEKIAGIRAGATTGAATITADARRDVAETRANAPAKPISLTSEAGLIQKLNTQWMTASKPIAIMHQQRQLMQTGLDAARRGDMAQGSQAVLVTFQKILDPPSVVRESEYNRSPAGLALRARVQGAYDRLVSGGAGVPLAELEKFAQLADAAIKAQSRGYLQAVKGRIGRVADRYGVPQELVFEDFEFGDEAAPEIAPEAAPAVGAPPAKRKYTVISVE